MNLKRDQTEYLKSHESHFRFGENWADFAKFLDQSKIDSAKKDLARLVDPSFLQGKTVLDIGSGSGIHSLAFLLHGAQSTHAFDIDVNSVATTENTLKRYAPKGTTWHVEQKSVFDLSAARECFDVVYSWGVLHHTGAMVEAIDIASQKVSPNGLLILALYRKTWFCAFWRFEKRIYKNLAPAAQNILIRVYAKLFGIFLYVLKRQRLTDYIKAYNLRGMSFFHDVHDWLGGYPYESIDAAILKKILEERGFQCIKADVKSSFVSRIGLFGSGCDEFVFQRCALT